MYTLGIDIGSTATKAVVLKNGKDIYASAIISFGAGTSGTFAYKKSLKLIS